MGDAVDDILHHLEAQLGHVGRDGVDGVDGADDDGPIIGALAVRHAGGFEIGHDCEILPDLTLKAVLGELFAEDRVGLAHGLEPVACDGTDAADAEAGAGERLPEDHVVGQTEGLADDADFILIQELDRLDQLEVQVFGQTANIVVALDGAGLENVGVDGALRKEVDAVELLGLFGKDVDEFLADDLALRFRVGHAGQLVEEAVDRVYIDEVRAELFAENLDNLLRLTLAEQTVVDMEADELLADRLDEQRRDDGAVDAAGQGEQDIFIADLGAKRGELFFDERLRKLRRGDTLHGFRTFVVHSSSQKSENSPIM